MGRLDGKVAFITGAGRGQGRSHAERLAAEGADIIAVDVCKQLDTVPYPMATPDDLAETARLVRALGRRIVAIEADVRDVVAMRAAVRGGVDELGSVDIVLANAGISQVGHAEDLDPDTVFREVVDVNLIGPWNTVHVTAPVMIDQGLGGAIVLTSSALGLSGRGGDGSPEISGYHASKHGVVGLMRSFAHWLAPHHIRVNSLHPNGVNTPMIVNDAFAAYVAPRPDLVRAIGKNLMPVQMVEPADVSNAIAWLVSDEGQYVTGVTLPIDAGFAIR